MTSKVAFFASRFARDAGVVPVQRYHCSVDLLRLFEFAQASQAGGLGQANLSSQFSIADAGIGLEGIKNLYIGAI